MSKTMNAWQFTTPSDGLEKSLNLVRTAPLPGPLSRQCSLVEVISAAINPLDYKVAEFPIFSRLAYGSLASPGIDFCGRVVESNGTGFHKGEMVYGRLDKPTKFGTLAQFTIAGKEIASLPEGVAPDDAAAIGTAGITSYQCLRIGGARPGAKVFINGGSGGSGTWSIQFAKAMGSEVTTSCSTRNVALCKSLGADEVIDYTKQDVIDALKTKGLSFDLVVDNVGSPSALYKEADHFLKPGSKFVQIGMSTNPSSLFHLLCRKLLPSALGNGSRAWIFHHATSNRQDLEQIGKWVAEKKVRPVFDRKFEWQQVPEAYARLKTGKAQGRIIVHVESKAKL